MRLKSTTFTTGVAAMLVIGMTCSASAQQIAQWNANNSQGGSSTYLAASSGINADTGVAAGYGQSNPPTPFSSVETSGSPVDPGTDVGGTLYNLGYVVNPPLTSTLNNTVGISFKVSTVGMTPGQALQISWSQTVGWRSSRYWQVLATTDGTNFSPVASGTGSFISQAVNGYSGVNEPSGVFGVPPTYTDPISGTATVNVSDSGLIDFRTMDQNHLGATNVSDVGYVNGITFTLPTDAGYENNPDFGFAIVGSFDPLYAGSDGAEGYLSSFAGLNSLDTTDGYFRSISGGGSMRVDMVTVTAVPEPATYAAILGVLGLLGVLIRRRRH